MEQEIKEYLKKNRFIYTCIPRELIIEVHELFIKGIIVQNPDNSMLRYYAIHYRIKKDYANAIKYYLLAAECGNTVALNGLASCYVEQNDESNAVKCWLMDIERCSPHAHSSMNSLGASYWKNDDYINAAKYFKMSSEHGNTNAMNNMAMYSKKQQDYANAFKYWSMAVEHNDYGNVDWALSCFKANKLLQYGITFVNKILNKHHNIEIIQFIMHFANNMDVDMVNIIINIDPDNSDPLFYKFKKLLNI